MDTVNKINGLCVLLIFVYNGECSSVGMQIVTLSVMERRVPPYEFPRRTVGTSVTVGTSQTGEC